MLLFYVIYDPASYIYTVLLCERMMGLLLHLHLTSVQVSLKRHYNYSGSHLIPRLIEWSEVLRESSFMSPVPGTVDTTENELRFGPAPVWCSVVYTYTLNPRSTPFELFNQCCEQNRHYEWYSLCNIMNRIVCWKDFVSGLIVCGHFESNRCSSAVSCQYRDLEGLILVLFWSKQKWAHQMCLLSVEEASLPSKVIGPEVNHSNICLCLLISQTIWQPRVPSS